MNPISAITVLSSQSQRENNLVMYRNIISSRQRWLEDESNAKKNDFGFAQKGYIMVCQNSFMANCMSCQLLKI